MIASDNEPIRCAPPKRALWDIRSTFAVNPGSIRIISAKSSQFASPSSSNSSKRGNNSNAGGKNEKLAISESTSGQGRLPLSPREFEHVRLTFIYILIGIPAPLLDLNYTLKH